uniref:Uncharacterized protein n=1 Tax=Vespula pensylvanica TaxID=30213 RepID=A0A834JLX3_VESPE|nr:hypothetical protein H0235_017771 [Vespula pensylvanica]
MNIATTKALDTTTSHTAIAIRFFCDRRISSQDDPGCTREGCLQGVSREEERKDEEVLGLALREEEEEEEEEKEEKDKKRKKGKEKEKEKERSKRHQIEWRKRRRTTTIGE